MLAKNETALLLAQLAAEQATAEALRRKSIKDKPMEPRWYLAHGGGTEKQTLEEFNRFEIEFYSPQTWGQERVPKRELTLTMRNSVVMRPVKIALWRRYYFVRIDLRSPQWRDCFERAAIYGIMANSEGGRLLPAPVNDAVVLGIRALEIDGAIPPELRVRQLLFAAGDEVQIKKGPFTNGIIEDDVEKPIGRLDESAKVKVALSLLGRSCVVEVPIGDLEKL